MFLSGGLHLEKQRRIMEGIERVVKRVGFDPYLATREQTLAGLYENVFRRLLEADRADAKLSGLARLTRIWPSMRFRRTSAS